MRTPSWCRHAAGEVGPACAQVIDSLMVDNALYRLRAAQGVLGLRTKYTQARLENACATAIAAGDPSYRTIKGLLAAGLDTTDAATSTDAERAAATAAVPAFLRGQESLFDLPEAPRTGDTAVVPTPTTSRPSTTDQRESSR
jgi:hypothetical protein